MRFTLFLSILMMANIAFAELTVRYSSVKGGNGRIRAEIMTADGEVLGTGYSEKSGSRSSKKSDALDEALDDAEENQEK